MDVSGVNSTSAYSAAAKADTKAQEKAADTAKEAAKDSDQAVVYEKSKNKKTDSANTIYSKDKIVAQLKADQQSRMDSLQSLVTKLLSKQKDKYGVANIFGDDAKNVKSIFADAAKNADPATIAQAQADIAEDGYWGVEKTSDRLVEMAKALSGGDPDKADQMIAAIKKGYDQATKAWGDKLPDICQKTVDAAIEKLNNWKSGLTGEAV